MGFNQNRTEPTTMPRYRIYGTLTVRKYLGEIEASTDEDAIAAGYLIPIEIGTQIHQLEITDLNNITAELIQPR